MFFIGITVILILFLIVFSSGVFLSKPQEVPSAALVLNAPKVNIDMTIFDSEEFKNLQPFPELETQYSYIALTKANKQEIGFVSAVSLDDARKILTDRGLTISDVKELQIGRDNPFIPYYQQPVARSAVIKTTAAR